MGPRSMPCGAAFTPVQVEAVGLLAVAVAERARAQGEVEQALGPAVVVALAERRPVEARASAASTSKNPSSIAATSTSSAGWPRHAPARRIEDLPLLGPSVAGREDRRRVLRCAADRERSRSGRRDGPARAARGPGRITSAWRVVSFIQLSTLIMQSSPSRAASRRSPPGVDRTGLPATVNSARICPSPGVAISSARHDTGTCPSTSGAPRTRLCPAAEVRRRRPRGPASAGRSPTTTDGRREHGPAEARRGARSGR